MIFDLVTIFPEMFDALQHGVLGRAIEQGHVQVNIWNLRDYTDDPYRRVDDRPFGGGPGMVMKVEPLMRCVEAIQNQANGPVKLIALTPDGQPLKQAKLRESVGPDAHFALICGRYEGFDQRFIDLKIDECWSIGDYVLSGGELPAMVIIDGMTRLLPGVLGDALSAEQDSFSEDLLDCPHYTRPEVFEGVAVDPVLLSGDHAAIARFRAEQSLRRTYERRPDLIDEQALTKEEQAFLRQVDSENKH